MKTDEIQRANTANFSNLRVFQYFQLPRFFFQFMQIISLNGQKNSEQVSLTFSTKVKVEVVITQKQKQKLQTIQQIISQTEQKQETKTLQEEQIAITLPWTWQGEAKINLRNSRTANGTKCTKPRYTSTNFHHLARTHQRIWESSNISQHRKYTQYKCITTNVARQSTRRPKIQILPMGYRHDIHHAAMVYLCGIQP